MTTLADKDTRFNALQHGVLSRYTVLPWESQDEYEAILAALVAEHGPVGPTEEHLVEELAGVLWRKRRLRIAETAALQHGLQDATVPYRETVEAALVHITQPTKAEGVVDAVRATDDQTEADLADDRAMTDQAIESLENGANGAYGDALELLRADTQAWWRNELAAEPDLFEELDNPYRPTAADLLRFLRDEVTPWYVRRRHELVNRPQIRQQAIGDAHYTDRLDRVARYEAHLDRKFERTLAMLIKLQGMQRIAKNV